MKLINEMTPAEKEARVCTPEVLWKMGRLGGSALSPDGASVAYSVTLYDMAENKGRSTLYLMPSEGGEAAVLSGDESASSPSWSGDGQTLYYLSDRSGDTQLWSQPAGGGKAVQVTDVEGGIEGYGVAPAGNNLFYVKRVHVKDVESSAVYADMDKSKALIYDDLMARHWNYWDRGDYLHIFVAPLNGGKAGEGLDILEGQPWDAPMAPYFNTEEVAWNNAGTQLAYTCKKMTGRDYAVSTDSDIFLYDLASGSTRNICKDYVESGDGDMKEYNILIEGNRLTRDMPPLLGYDKYPVFSPDDSKIAFRSMRRPGNESDKERLFVWNSADGSMTDLTAGFDYDASNVVWDGEERIWFVSPIEGTHQICTVDINGKVDVITSGDHDINSFTKAGSRVVASLTTMVQAPELVNVELSDGAITPLSDINGHIYANLDLAQTTKRWVETTDGKKMLVWVILPPNFDPAKKYPALLYCQGGPQNVVSPSFSFRWNHLLMASQGYVVVAPNRRGLPSFGQEWLDQISGDYSGQNIRDYLSAIDNVAKEPWVDEARLGCVGASYGGYSAFFLAGNHDNRFKAFIAHCGIYNFESMYGETEELWFVNNDYGGPYWSKNPTAVRSYANSPHKFIDKWNAPILIYTGLNDFRIPYTQSLEAFTAARLKGIPSRLVAFENEAHQVFKPQNSLTWNREFFGWLDKYVGNPEGASRE